tara:strand:- start:3594 stop:3833 length:240 start_codon:yes stop_codon:yes gene_type:complete
MNDEVSRKNEILGNILSTASGNNSQLIKSFRKLMGDNMDAFLEDVFELMWEFKYEDIENDKRLHSRLEKLIKDSVSDLE